MMVDDEDAVLNPGDAEEAFETEDADDEETAIDDATLTGFNEFGEAIDE